GEIARTDCSRQPSALREADEVVRRGAAHLLFPVAAAQRYVNILADRHLLALPGHLAVGAKAHHHRRLVAAAADGAHLAQFVRQRQQSARAGKQIALEIGPEAVAHDRDVQPVGDAGKLPYLVVVEELRLVDEDAVYRRAA